MKPCEKHEKLRTGLDCPFCDIESLRVRVAYLEGVELASEHNEEDMGNLIKSLRKENAALKKERDFYAVKVGEKMLTEMGHPEYLCEERVRLRAVIEELVRCLSTEACPACVLTYGEGTCEHYVADHVEAYEAIQKAKEVC